MAIWKAFTTLAIVLAVSFFTVIPAFANGDSGSSGKNVSSSEVRSDNSAVRFALTQLGKPYVWGGNGKPGYDCSGLVKAAYPYLPRTADAQYRATSRVSAPQPGDLLFFGSPRHITHVGIYAGGNNMIHASTFGQPVKVSNYKYFRNFVGVGRA